MIGALYSTAVMLDFTLINLRFFVIFEDYLTCF